jgi:carboxypeptidase T
MAYLSAASIEACLQYLAATYPTICQLIVLPEPSVEGRTSRAVKISKGSGDRHGVLFIGGVHARELVNPDLLAGWALDLCEAYTTNTGLTYGPKTFEASTVKLLVEALDIFVFPLVNPDGRVHVQSPAGDPWWRKNRNQNPGQPCKGVDVNRNYDFLWTSGIGTSAAACSDVFKGASAFSEPETRNVRSLLEHYPNIDCMMDVHSYSELVLYPWGDDENQSTDPAMNFQNPLYNDLRGVAGDALYKEYMPAADADWFQSTGERVRDAIAAVRGRVYTAEQSIYLYPTSGTAHDYAYSRHMVDVHKHRVFAYTLETGTEFQPPDAEAQNIIAEVSSGLTEFCIACLCVVEVAAAFGQADTSWLERLRRFRDRGMVTTAAGRRYMAHLQRHSGELLRIAMKSGDTRTMALETLKRVAETLPAQGKRGRTVPPEVVRRAENLMDVVSKTAGTSLRETIEEIRGDIRHFEGATIAEGLSRASDAKGPKGGGTPKGH